MVRTARPRRAPTAQIKRLKRVRASEFALPATAKVAISTIKSKLPKPITAKDIRSLLRKNGGRKSADKSQKRPLLKKTFIRPLTERQARTRADEAGQRAITSATRRLPALRVTSKKIKRVSGRSNTLLRRCFVRPFRQPGLQVRPSANATLTKYLSSIQSRLHNQASKLKYLKQIKRRKLSPRKARRNRRGMRRTTKVVKGLKVAQRRLKDAFKREQPAPVARHLSATELRRTLIADTTHTPSGRHRLVRRFLEAGRLSRSRFYDPRPRIDHPTAVRLPRKSSRRKRYLVKYRRLLVAKIKRKLRRRRSRQRAVVIKKRKYHFTPRSPAHAGRTVV